MSQGHAGGKIILMGEHAVVYGYPAIALPFSAVQVQVTVEEKGDSLSLSCALYQGLVHEMPRVWESLKHAIRLSLYRLGAPTDPGLHIEIESTIPPERGMGSSAAVAVAIARALFAFYGKDLSDKELWEIVQSAEAIAHGNPSGVDAATTSGQKPIWFVKGSELEHLELCLDAYLVVADTGKMGQTLSAVEDVADLLCTQPDAEAELVALGTLTQQARLYLATNQADKLGQVMNQAHHHLQILGVSDEALDKLVEVAQEGGALGAKLTGGGRGGCMIALADTRKKADDLVMVLKEAGASQTWIQQIGE